MFVAAFRRNRIVTLPAPGIAAQDALDAEITSVKKSMNLQSFKEIGRTSRREPTNLRRKRRNAIAINPDQGNERCYENFFEHCFLDFRFVRRSDCRIC